MHCSKVSNPAQKIITTRTETFEMALGAMLIVALTQNSSDFNPGL
jgi:hypothetical protein